MNDENNYGSPALDDLDYPEPSQRNSGPTGVSAPVLDDFGYSAPTEKKGGPTGVSAPVLDDDNYVPDYSQKKGAPTGVSAPVLDDDNYSYQKPSAPQKLVLSDQDIIDGLSPELKDKFYTLTPDQQQKIIEMRRSQLGAEAPAPALSAPVLDEDNYTPPPKKEEHPQPETPISAPVLDDEPEPPKYVPKFVDEDLERAKKEGAKKAMSSSMVSEQKDSKESLRMMLELKEQQREELAKKGFKLLIVTAVIGIITAVAFCLLYSGSLGLDYKNGLGSAAEKLSDSSFLIAMLMGITGLTLMTGFGAFKTITTIVYGLAAILQIFPGLAMIPQHEGSMALVILLYAVSLGGTIAVLAMLSASEAVGAFFSKRRS